MPISSLKHVIALLIPCLEFFHSFTRSEMGKVRKAKSLQDSTDEATCSNWAQLKKVSGWVIN